MSIFNFLVLFNYIFFTFDYFTFVSHIGVNKVNIIYVVRLKTSRSNCQQLILCLCAAGPSPPVWAAGRRHYRSGGVSRGSAASLPGVHVPRAYEDTSCGKLCQKV